MTGAIKMTRPTLKGPMTHTNVDDKRRNVHIETPRRANYTAVTSTLGLAPAVRVQLQETRSDTRLGRLRSQTPTYGGAIGRPAAPGVQPGHAGSDARAVSNSLGLAGKLVRRLPAGAARRAPVFGCLLLSASIAARRSTSTRVRRMRARIRRAGTALPPRSSPAPTGSHILGGFYQI